MKEKIEAQIKNINDSLAWIKRHKPEQYDQQYLHLVGERRKLRRLVNALSDNPAIAAFGESQVGKSHLMNCILQKDGQPYMVQASDEKYKFITKINPKGDGNEATGVVTRFSSFTRCPNDYSADFPVLARLLSVKDIILILADSYYTDFDDYVICCEKEIVDCYEQWEARYGGASAPQPKPILTSDDILDMQEYFEKYINQGQVFLTTAFFRHVALFIESVPSTDFVALFSILWHNDEMLTEHFRRCLEVLRRLRFESQVYLPIEAVLHHDIKNNTVMSVECLKRFYDKSYKSCTNVYIREDGKHTDLGSFTKSEICAVCSEVVFRIPEELYSASQEGHYPTEEYYDIDSLPSANTIKETLNGGKVERSILENNDLFDFPGARSRKAYQFKKLYEPDKDIETRTETLIECFLRGKVAYLFNKYNNNLNINVLLYCHHGKKSEVNYLGKLVENWVNTYVGKTAEEREIRLKETGGISPLFCISTMFNLHLLDKDAESTDSETAISERWKARFETALLDGVLARKQVKWLDDWTTAQRKFKNTYVLRDFKYSRNIYEGYEVDDEGNVLGEEAGPNLQSDFKKDKEVFEHYFATMRRTFIGNKDVRDYFQSPEIAWDLSTSRRNDGALYIIQNLSKVAECMNTARQKQFEVILKASMDSVYRLMSSYYIPEDKSEILEGNIVKARSVKRELAFACNDDNYFFGHLIQALQITESECCQEVHRIINSGELNKIHTFNEYEIIRHDCHDFNGCTTTEEKWACLQTTYALPSFEAVKDYLDRRGVEANLLFSAPKLKKLNSYVIADSVLALWEKKIRAVNFLSALTEKEGIFDALVMSDLVENLVETSRVLRMEEVLQESIAEYVNVINPATANESLVADLLASEISNFVVNFGYDLLSPESKESAKNLAKQRNIPAFNYIERERKSTYDEEELTALFNELGTGQNVLTPAFENSYDSWLEYMFISFIAHLNVPNFDIEANREVFEILKKIA